MSLQWRFPMANRGNKSGFSHGGIESFTGERIGSLTREIIQNSLDAKSEDKINEPVIVEFNSFNIKDADFPERDELLHHMKLALTEAEKLRDSTTRNFFQRAIDILTSDKIKMLRISDFNTTGLVGVEKDDHTPWHYLVRSQGVSDKAETAGGSFGIGKNASFAVSNLRTVFYETLTIDGIKGSQGVSNLISYTIEELNDFTQGIGYYGVTDKHEPFRDFLNLDNKFNRSVPGTDIYIAGFLGDDNFEINIINSVLESFIYAIYINDLEVKVNNISINQNTLDGVVKKYENHIEKTTYEMYQLLTDRNTEVFSGNILDTKHPDLELRIMLKEEGSRKVSMLRKPWMKITNFDRFHRAYQFSGMALIKGDELNRILRSVENPQHNAWQTDRLSENQEKKKYADNVLANIRSFITSKLQDLYHVELSEYIDIFGASDYLPQISDESDIKAHDKVKEKTTGVEIKKKTPPPVSNQVLSFDDGDALIELDGEELVDIFRVEDEPAQNKGERDKIVDEVKKGRKVSLTKQNYRILAISPLEGNYR